MAKARANKESPNKNMQKVSTDILAKVPIVFTAFKETIENFVEKTIEKYEDLDLPHKKLLSITKHIVLRYLAPLILRICENHIENDLLPENGNSVSYEGDEDVIEMQNLVQKNMRALPDLHTKCQFSHTVEVFL